MDSIPEVNLSTEYVIKFEVKKNEKFLIRLFIKFLIEMDLCHLQTRLWIMC